jgi:hypothetical protein
MKATRISSLLLLCLASTALSADTGNFDIQSTDFATLFNYGDRAVQPKRVPWAGSYFAYGTGGIADETFQRPSSSERYDQTFRRGTPLATRWEKEHHSCESVAPELKEGCKSWWGHCNAWSAAAIKEDEPREPITSSGAAFSVGDQKAYLTELWMNSDSLFAGDTDKETRTGSWIYEKNSTKAQKSLDYGSGTAYDAFWDVTPTAFFHLFTNYVGLMGTSVVIDRFTGDEVWNHPVAGYRLLPIRKEDKLDAVTRGSRTLYPVRLRMKIYWANDAVQAGHVTEGFDIKKTGDDERVRVTWPNSIEYEGRLLKFTLFFTAPVETNEDGTKVLSAGKIVGDGIWYHQENQVSNADETHPDFIWLPTQLTSYGGDANPYIESKTVHGILTGAGTSEDKEPESVDMLATFLPKTFRARLPTSIARVISLALKREAILAEVPADQIVKSADGTIETSIRLKSKKDEERLMSVLVEAGIPPYKLLEKP